MKCRICGTENPDDEKWCRECGSPLKDEPEEQQVLIEEPPTGTTKEEKIEPTPVTSKKVVSKGSLAQLHVKRFGGPTGEVFEICSENIILGRFSPDTGPVDIDLSGLPESEYISRKHARIFLKEGKWYVEDLNSTNGVFVNRGERITTAVEIKNGDEIALGNLIMNFYITKYDDKINNQE